MNRLRRQFLSALSLSAVAGCSAPPPEHRYNSGDIALLAEQRRQDAANKARGRFHDYRFSKYQGLAELPWFELTPEKQLRCTDESVDGAIDMHCHLGMSVLFKPGLDLLATHRTTKHLLHCDDPNTECELHLDQYANGNFDQTALKQLRSEIRNQGLWGSESAETQTVPNLLHELDLMRFDRAVLLPIKLGLWFGDDLTEQWRAASAENQRLSCGFSVHPLKKGWETQMRQHAKQGLKLMKLHPTVQRFYPDDPALMPVYETAVELGVNIFFHGGRAGIEPSSSHRYAMPRHYNKAFADFPAIKFIIGHAGARDFAAMLALSQKYANTWIGTHGQGLSNLTTLLERTGGQRVLFGSDWPFYHIAMSLAKLLIVTNTGQGKSMRQQILRDNALAFLAGSFQST